MMILASPSELAANTKSIKTPQEKTLKY